MADNRTRAQTNRAIRQEAIREQLANKGLLQKVIEDVEKLDEPGAVSDGLELQRVKVCIDTRLKLINKYLPDLKAAEITGEGGQPLTVEAIIRKIIDPKS